MVGFSASDRIFESLNNFVAKLEVEADLCCRIWRPGLGLLTRDGVDLDIAGLAADHGCGRGLYGKGRDWVATVDSKAARLSRFLLVLVGSVFGKGRNWQVLDSQSDVDFVGRDELLISAGHSLRRGGEVQEVRLRRYRTGIGPANLCLSDLFEMYWVGKTSFCL